MSDAGSARCPCGLGPDYAECCGPRHDGARPAETAEALMRARYSAFARGRGDFLVATHDAPAGPGEAAALARWAGSVTWLGLEVMAREGGGPGDDVGSVEFTARYLEDGAVVSLRERSAFQRHEGRWRYVAGTPQVRTEKAARNAPCPCGSGKKFKQCHA